MKRETQPGRFKQREVFLFYGEFSVGKFNSFAQMDSRGSPRKCWVATGWPQCQEAFLRPRKNPSAHEITKIAFRWTGTRRYGEPLETVASRWHILHWSILLLDTNLLFVCWQTNFRRQGLGKYNHRDIIKDGCCTLLSVEFYANRDTIVYLFALFS